MNQEAAATAESDPSANRTIRVLVVDDHPAFRYGLKSLLTRMDDVSISGEAYDAATALQAFRDQLPDLVLMDISLPGTNGIELIKMMRAERRDQPILIVSMHDESFYGLRALRAGARGYLRKDHTLEDLAEAVRCTARNEYYLSRRFQNQLIQKAIHDVDDVEAGGDSMLQNLSDREMEVFHWLGRGLGTRQVAGKLGLSIKTVETHRAHIKSKLNLDGAESMVRLAKEWVALEEKKGQPSSSGEPALNQG